MKLKLLLSALLMAGLLSCSSDDDGDSGSNTIEGTWDAVTLQLDSASQEEQSLADIIYGEFKHQLSYRKRFRNRYVCL